MKVVIDNIKKEKVNLNKKYFLDLLQKWSKEIESMEAELKFCDNHSFNLERNKIHSNIMILIGCKSDLSDVISKINCKEQEDSYNV